MSKSPISIVFCGTSEFAVASLQTLAKDPAFTILLVITQPDRPVGRKQKLTPPPVKTAAEQLGLKVLQTENFNADFKTPIPALRDASVRPVTSENEQSESGPEPSRRAELLFPIPPDFLLVIAFGQLLSQQILDWPTQMPINVHGSLLPRWRGAAPIHQAILAGDTETGVTVQKMVKALDAGPVLSQEAVTIDARETFQTLYERLAILGADLLVRTLKQPLNPIEQDEGKVTVCRKLSRADGIADQTAETAPEIDRKVRALTPWPGVTMKIMGQDLKILQTALVPQDNAYVVDCKDGSKLYLVQVQPSGKKAMSGAEWSRGLQR